MWLYNAKKCLKKSITRKKKSGFLAKEISTKVVFMFWNVNWQTKIGLTLLHSFCGCFYKYRVYVHNSLALEYSWPSYKAVLSKRGIQITQNWNYDSPPITRYFQILSFQETSYNFLPHSLWMTEKHSLSHSRRLFQSSHNSFTVYRSC